MFTLEQNFETDHIGGGGRQMLNITWGFRKKMVRTVKMTTYCNYL